MVSEIVVLLAVGKCRSQLGSLGGAETPVVEE
jgi:hypothetical protein